MLVRYLAPMHPKSDRGFVAACIMEALDHDLHEGIDGDKPGGELNETNWAENPVKAIVKMADCLDAALFCGLESDPMFNRVYKQVKGNFLKVGREAEIPDVEVVFSTFMRAMFHPDGGFRHPRLEKMGL